MPIEKGTPWGRSVDRPARLLELVGDEAVAAYASDRPDGADQFAATVKSGDLHRSLGGPSVAADSHSVQLLKLDLLRITADGNEFVAAANVVARGGGRFGWWRGPIVAVCNVDHLGEWNVAPKAHPNDGRFDVIEVDATMSVRARAQARGRLPQGNHVPHPAITQRQASRWGRTFDRPLALFVDGRPVGKVQRLEVTIEVDAFELHV